MNIFTRINNIVSKSTLDKQGRVKYKLLKHQVYLFSLNVLLLFFIFTLAFIQFHNIKKSSQQHEPKMKTSLYIVTDIRKSMSILKEWMIYGSHDLKNKRRKIWKLKIRPHIEKLEVLIHSEGTEEEKLQWQELIRKLGTLERLQMEVERVVHKSEKNSPYKDIHENQVDLSIPEKWGVFQYGLVNELIQLVNNVDSTLTHYSQTQEHLLDQLMHRSKSISLALIGLFIPLSVVMCFSLFSFYHTRVEKVLNPIKKLTDATREIILGEKVADIHVINNDELGELTSSFNQMKNLLYMRTKKLVENKVSLFELTKRLSSEEKQQRSAKDLVVNIIERAPYAMVISNEEQKIVFANTHVLELFGYVGDDLLGRSIDVLIPERFRHKHVGYVKQYYKTTNFPEMISMRDLVGLHKEGHEINVEIKLSPIEIDKEWCVMAVISDITERKKMEINLQKTTSQAKHLAAAKTRFLANMSHEIRTPLNAILGFSAILQKTSLTDEQKSYLDMVNSSGDLLIGIINDILDLAKYESGEIVLESIDFDLEELINSVFTMIVSRMKDRPFETYIDIDSELPRYYKGDPIRIKQILINLLSNAIKFTQEGQIGVIVNRESLPDLEKGEFALSFKVKDSGIGMDKKSKEHIFDAFSQADESTTRMYGGTGLGLAITKTLVELMGGSIRVESKPGKGSEFIFSLVLKEGDEDGAIKDRNVPMSILGKRVLIIDDSRFSRRILSSCVDVLGLKLVGTAESGQEALNILSKLTLEESLPDLIICDLIMEGMDGYEFMCAAKKNPDYKHIKFIAVTADVNAKVSKADENEFAFDHIIIKPIVIENLLKNIIKLFTQDQNVNEVVEKDKDKALVGMTILVVEDNIANQELMKVVLGEFGCTTEVAENGKVAIEKIKSNQYDMCFMDMQMPVMGGIEATNIIRTEVNELIPIVALTANATKEDREKINNAGLNDYLTKPIDVDRLKDVILRYKNVT